MSNAEPVSDQLADIILQKRPKLYDFYTDLLARLNFTSIYDQTQPTATNRSQAIGHFLSAWIILERSHALNDNRTALRQPYRSGDISRWAERIGLSSTSLETIRDVRRIRNQVVHGIEIPSPRFLDEATQRLREVLLEIENHHDERVRQSYRDAQQALHG